jgi:hypothetical protein
VPAHRRCMPGTRWEKEKTEVHRAVKVPCPLGHVLPGLKPTCSLGAILDPGTGLHQMLMATVQSMIRRLPNSLCPELSLTQASLVATMEISMEFPQKLKQTFHMIQPYHFWMCTQKESKLTYCADTSNPCLLRHYSQKPKYRISLSAINS